MSDRKVTLAINLDDLTLGDLADIEDACGVSMLDLKGGAKIPARVIPALVWIAERHNDPSFTYEQARAVKVTSLDVQGGPAAGVANPPEAAA